MRRNSIIILIALLFVGALAVSADEAVIMDFSLLKADILPDQANQGKFLENRATMMDFSGTAGASYTAEQKKQMRVSLAIRNWDVVLASSSRNTTTTQLSQTAEATLTANAPQFAGKTVLGVRVRFPLEDFNSWAKVQPPYEIPAFEPKATVDDQGNITPAAAQAGTDPVNASLTRFEGSYDANTKIITALGIVKNVGVIKSVAVTVKGLNFPHGLTLVLKDADGNEKSMFMGYLNFDGWKELRWENPAYVSDVRNRELRIYPLYPKTVPMVKLDGFVFTRDADSVGGDFVTYIKDVKILYDKAVLEPVRDIDDEAIWGIVSKKEDDRKISESKRFGNQQVLRYIEKLKQESKTDFTPTK
ncbi:MAG TPA: flagellar filament outer layer protein FlaA [Rectinemataceae bacterium]|nr:flagellar filament outer layer protein FlaA [Rectinemataceae bacterium]